jgi:hypothetical protein
MKNISPGSPKLLLRRKGKERCGPKKSRQNKGALPSVAVRLRMKTHSKLFQI